MAGSVALYCVANGKIKQEGFFKNRWIQPAAGEAGGSLGAAFATWPIYLKKKSTSTSLCNVWRLAWTIIYK